MHEKPHFYTTRELAALPGVVVLVDDQVLTVAQVRRVTDGAWAVDFTRPLDGDNGSTLHVADSDADTPLWERGPTLADACFIGTWIIHPAHDYRATVRPTGTTGAYLVTRKCPGRTEATVLGYRPGVTRVCTTQAEWQAVAERIMQELPGQPGQ